MALNVYIDANIYLDFYDFSDASLAELEQLIALVEKGQITLLVPSHTGDEFRRHRETRLARSLKQMGEYTNVRLPIFTHEYQEYEEVRDLQKRLSAKLDDLNKSVNADIEDFSLKADKLFNRLMVSARRIPSNAESIHKAEDRVKRMNPPGKKGSTGDAINWETLVGAIAPDEALIIVSRDGDFYSPLDTSRPLSFLSEEFRRRVGGSLQAYKSLLAFIQAEVPSLSIESLSMEPASFLGPKRNLIARLKLSHSYQETHEMIAELAQFDSFSSSEAAALLDAAVSNGQVRRILGDEDVRSFYQGLKAEHFLTLTSAPGFDDVFSVLDEEGDGLRHEGT